MGSSNNKQKFKVDTFCENRYKITKVLKPRSGYFLYQAEDTLYRNSKVLIQEMSISEDILEEELSLLKITAEILQNMNVSNLFTLEDFEINPSNFALVMEHFEGLSLEDYANTNPGRSTLLLIFFQIILAVSELHKCSILHANLRPDNIFIGIGGLTKLGGLTMLRADPYSHLSKSLFSGTPGYSPPEVWEKDVGLKESSDVYSLGSLLYFCVTEGQHPSRVLSHSRIPDEFRTIILKARQPKAKDRYQSVSELEDALLSLLSDSEANLTPLIEASLNDDNPLQNTVSDNSDNPSGSDVEDLGRVTDEFHNQNLEESEDPLEQNLEEGIQSNENLNQANIDDKNITSTEEDKLDQSSIDLTQLEDLKLRKEIDRKPDLPQRKDQQDSNESDDITISDVENSGYDDESEAFIESHKNSAGSENSDLLNWINFLRDKMSKSVSVTPVLGIVIGIFGLSLFITSESPKLAKDIEKASVAISSEIDFRVVGSLLVKKLEDIDWRVFTTRDKLSKLDRFFSRDGNSQILDRKLKFKLQMQQGSILQVADLKGSPSGSKTSIELIIEEGEFIFNAGGTRLYIELVDQSCRINARKANFKVKKTDDRSIYYVKAGWLSIQLPNQVKRETVYPGSIVHLQSGVITSRSKFDTELSDF